MSQKIKLLSIIETLGKGGAERVLANTLPELQKLGIECEVAILFERDDLAEELEEKGVKVHRLDLSHKWSVVEGTYKLHKLVREGKYDIVHAHLFFAYFYAGLMKMFNSKVATVTTFHNLAYNTYPATTIFKKVRKQIDAFVVNHFIDRKVGVSSAVKKHFEEHLKIEKVNLIYNSFPLDTIDTFTSVDRNTVLKQYIEDTRKYDVFSITPGRLVKEKGHKYLLEALKDIKKSAIEICHLIVGIGPLKGEIEKTVYEYGLSDNVIVLESLSQIKLFELMRVCDFSVVPSIAEGFGMVVGESMVLGTPIISTEIDGIVDLVDKEVEGLLVPPQDPKALAAAIERLYEDKELRERLVENAKEKIKQFDTKVIAQQWRQYYSSIIKSDEKKV